MNVKITGTTALFPKGFLIQWTVQNVTESGIFSFSIYRSGGTNGPWEEVATNLTNQYAYFDNFEKPFVKTTENVLRPNQLNLFREYVYKIVCITPNLNTLEDINDNGPLFEGNMNDLKMEQIARKLRRDFRLTLKFNGTSCAFLKRRRWGTRCEECFDKKTKEIMRASCKKCWGTGLIGGYWDPILSVVRRNVGTNASAITPQQKSDSNDIQIWMPEIPQVEQDDLLIFFKDQKRYRLDQSTETEIRLGSVHQVISGQEIEHSDIRYKIPVNLNQVPSLF